MRWDYEDPPKQYDVKRVKRFALFPVDTNNGKHTVWLEDYYEVYRYIKCPVKGMHWYMIDKEYINQRN